MKKILVATDFSPAAENATTYAAQMAMAIGAELTLFHVYPVPVVYAEVPAAVEIDGTRIVAEENIAKQEAALFKATNGALNIDSVLRMGAFYQELKTVCELLQPYTVVMGCQGTSATDRFLFGNHAVHAMEHLNWPLITVPASVQFTSVKKIALACDLNEGIEETAIDEIRTMVKDLRAELHVLNTGKEPVFEPDKIFESGM
ncbi:MAG TPA: universal stress protein, partial [Ferruginibacter sp.]|nr:universal stress protein [Ferruginibacter sp.]